MTVPCDIHNGSADQETGDHAQTDLIQTLLDLEVSDVGSNLVHHLLLGTWASKHRNNRIGMLDMGLSLSLSLSLSHSPFRTLSARSS